MNGINTIRGALDSCLNQTAKDIEIIVVDNGSTDGSLKLIENDYPAVKVIANARDFGVSGSFNIGLSAARGRYVLFLNNDIVAPPRWVEEIRRILESDERVGAASSIATYADGETIWCAGGGVDFATGQNWHLMKGGPRSRIPKGKTVVDYVPGLALMTPRDLISRIGGFDKHMYMYTEDVDLCTTLERMGYKCVVSNGEYITHYVSQSRRTLGWEKAYASLAYSQLHFIFKQFPLRMFPPSMLFQSILLPLAESLFLGLSNRVIIIRVRALWMNLRRLREAIIERSIVERSGHLENGVRVRLLLLALLRLLKLGIYEW